MIEERVQKGHELSRSYRCLPALSSRNGRVFRPKGSFVRDQAGGIEISFWFLGLIFKYKGYRNLPIFGSSYTHVESDCVNYCVAEGSARSRNESYLFFFYIS